MTDAAPSSHCNHTSHTVTHHECGVEGALDVVDQVVDGALASGCVLGSKAQGCEHGQATVLELLQAQLLGLGLRLTVWHTGSTARRDGDVGQLDGVGCTGQTERTCWCLNVAAGQCTFQAAGPMHHSCSGPCTFLVTVLKLTASKHDNHRQNCRYTKATCPRQATVVITHPARLSGSKGPPG